MKKQQLNKSSSGMSKKNFPQGEKNENHQLFYAKSTINKGRNMNCSPPPVKNKTPGKSSNPTTPIVLKLTQQQQVQISTPQQPQGKENSTSLPQQAVGNTRYPQILERAVKRAVANTRQDQRLQGNVVQVICPGSYQSFTNEKHGSEGYEAYESIIGPHQQQEVTNRSFYWTQQNPSSPQQGSTGKLSMYQESNYVDYVITNLEVQRFLKKCFIYNGTNKNEPQQDMSASALSSARSGGTQQTPNQQQPQSRVGSVSPNKRLICEAWDRVPIAYFIRLLLKEFPDVMEEQNVSDALLHSLKASLKELICDDDQPAYLSLNKLQLHTKSVGLLGLLTQALKTVSPKNNKNQPQELLQPNDQILIRNNHIAAQNFTPYTTEFSQFFGSSDIKGITNVLQDYANDQAWRIEDMLNLRTNDQMRRLVNKCRDVERLIANAHARIADNYDLFQKESRTRNSMKELKNRLDEQEKTIFNLQKQNQVLAEQCQQNENITEIKHQILRLENEKKQISAECEKLKSQLVEKSKIIENQENLIKQLQSELISSQDISKKNSENIAFSSIDESDGQVLSQSPPKYVSIKVQRTPKTSTVPQSRVTSKYPSSSRVSPQRYNDPVPSNINKILLESLHAWQSTSMVDEYRFACILTTPESTQVSFQHYQLVSIIKSIPGMNELIQRGQNMSFLINYFIVNLVSQCLQNETSTQSQQTPYNCRKLIEFFENLVNSINLVSSEQECLSLIQLLLQITQLFALIKQVFSTQQIKEWQSTNHIKNLQDQQVRFLQSFLNSLLLLINYQYDDQQVQAQVRRSLAQLKYNSPQIMIYTRLLSMFYNQNPCQECVNLMKVQSEADLNVNSSKAFLNTDAVNLLLFPSLKNSPNLMTLLDSLLHFKCPGQYYAQYTEQVCRKENVETLGDLAVQLFNKAGQQDVICKIWEVLGAIAKSIGLKYCADHLNFVVKMYVQSPIYHTNQTLWSNIQIVQKNINGEY